MPPTPELHPILQAVAGYIDRHGWAAWVMDHELRVVHVSTEFRKLTTRDLDPILGKHFLEATLADEIVAISTKRSLMRAGLELIPMYVRHTPGGGDAVRAMLEELVGPGAGVIVDDAGDDPLPMVASTMKVRAADGMPSERGNFSFTQLRDNDGALVGFYSMYVSTLPFRFIPLLARGDEATLERAIRLAHPGPRQAAILFADLQSSGVLSSRLPSDLYFRLVQDITAALDDVVTTHAGIVGRHAGDGVTAFFLADDAGSPSGAARAVVEAARAITQRAAEIGARYEEQTEGTIAQKDITINVGLHWGSSLYMGQLTSSGRFEVTALGDAVNECARIQESASDGRVIASKQLLENLTQDDAHAVGIRAGTLAYERLGEIPGATEKAIRDAGGIPVTEL